MASTRISDIRGVGVADVIQIDADSVAFELSDGTTTDAVTLPPGPAGPNTVPTQQAVADAITTAGSAAEVAVAAKIASASGVPMLNVATQSGGALDPAGVAESSARFQATLDAAAAFGVGRVVAPPGTYKVRNLRIYSGTHLDLHGVTLVYGGTNGTVAPIESMPVVLYGEGSSGSPLKDILISGGTIVGNRDPAVWPMEDTGGQQDAFQFNYPTNSVVVSGVVFKDQSQDALVWANGTGGQTIGCTFTDVGDGCVEVRSGSGYKILNNFAERCKDFVPAKPDTTDVLVSGNRASVYNFAVAHLSRRWRISNNYFKATTTPDGKNGALTGHGLYIVRHPALAATENTIEDVVITGNTFEGWTGPNAHAVMILDDNGQTLNRIEVVGNTFKNCGKAVETEGGTVIADNGITASLYPVAVTGPRCAVTGNQITATGDSNNIAVTIAGDGCSVSGNHIQSVGTFQPSIVVSGNKNTITGNRVEGDATSTGQCITVSGDDNVVSANSGSGHNHGIRLTGTAERNILSANRCMGAQFHGIQVQAGAVDNVVNGNHLAGNNASGTTGIPLSDAGTNTVADDNGGIVLRSKGTNNIGDTTTSRAVNHGLPTTPTTVVLTPRAGELIWVSSRTSTQFIVTRTGSTGTLNFDWAAYV